MDYKSSNKSLKFQMIIKSCSKCLFKTNFFKWCDKCKLKHFELNYGKSPSGNNEIDKILKDNYCESNSTKELIEWIPYSEFKFINFANQELSKLYNAIWPNDYIFDQNRNKVCWNRVTLIDFEDLNDLLYHIIIFKRELQFYGITKNPISLNFILVFDYLDYNRSLIFKCQILPYFFNWCNKCKLKHFELNYGVSPSENNEIDKILKDNYCESNSSKELIEWIPYDEFKDVTHINEEIYRAVRSEGRICDWDEGKSNWSREIKNLKVLLINSEDSICLEEKLKTKRYVCHPYGITKNPVSLKYMLVFDYINYNLCLRCQFLNFFNWCEECRLNYFQLNYGESPSENNEIDKFLRNNYCESNSSEELIEWIPYNELKIINFANEELSKLYGAIWPKGYIIDWNKNEVCWNRESKNLRLTQVTLINFEDLNDLLYHIIIFKGEFQFYGITKNPMSLNFMLVFDYLGDNRSIIFECQILPYFFKWCNKCKLKHFELNYGKSPSENNKIDKILIDNYCVSNSSEELIEWIPYDEFKDVINVALDKNEETYSAVWSEGRICDWDEDKSNWSREIKNFVVILINTEDLMCLEEAKKYEFRPIGITKNPLSLKYMLVFDYINYDYNLCQRCQFLNFFDWCKECRMNRFHLVYRKSLSGYVDIDNFLKENYCESKSSKELIRWIPYYEFRDIIYIDEEEFSKHFIAIYHNLKVIMMEIENLDVLYQILSSIKKEVPGSLKSYKIHGISKNVLNYMLIFEYSLDLLKILNEPKRYRMIGVSKEQFNPVTYLKSLSQSLCSDCQSKESFFEWCDNCKMAHYSLNYGDLLSVNNDINVILKDNYCRSNKISEFIEWIPYDSFIDITFINRGGFSKVYSALWLNNHIYEWNHIKLEWERLSGYKNVALKVLESSCYNISGFLQEVQSYYKIRFSHKITKLYGISKDPNTQNYILVLEYVNHGSLRSFLDKYNKYLIITYKIQILKNIAEGLKEIHSKNIIHQDIHSENILTKDFDRVKITDLGLSKFINQQVNDNEKEKKVYGVLPYIAPEVLRGYHYTQKADIYAFGVIINEVFTGERPFENYTNEIGLRIDICKNGLRPEIRKNTPKSLVNLLNKCWDSTSSNRPTADEIIQKLNHFETDDIIFEELRNCNNEILRQYVESTNNSDYQKPFL
ncbi:hypothetical protein RclHR1_03430004 [Rhizophagus clarus]|uniref:Kinase-like domain-containing protein n=1 Tax=Rhizophagus clarus TaxID=94130 RepID=A0A2Z6RAJ9_9GLOM|nr:hypothetical protein RclHR1_03430004 [Rhizophagus clarus]GES79918.1 kinase-like domain-containing protein [Rhizophagus clarus]